MEHTDKRFVVGIDLGTTNCAVAYSDLHAGRNSVDSIKLFKIPQLTGQGEVSGLSILPSFLYLPGSYDIATEARLPWEETGDSLHIVGTFARDHGAKVPARLVSSAKSWLCHQHVDRKARILPWGSSGDVSKVSPVQATTAYLEHIKHAWNSFRADNDDERLENQLLILTVPASFDEVARELTVEAAALAGLTSVTLLEEPLAAFYSWLINHENDWDRFVSPNELVLICDVGGGTTDFTLISLRDVEGSPRFERVAVGDHLILGGDNMDLALARWIEMRIGQKTSFLKGDRWKTLCHQCRLVKEALLEGTATSKRITIIGEGGRLIKGTLSADLTGVDVEKIILDGFFPLVDTSPKKSTLSQKGISEFGLPYEQEPAITRHLGWFLDKHKADISNYSSRDAVAPDCILFNGGALKPSIIQERICKSIRGWFHIDDPGIPRVLENPDPDIAVALGAAYYGLVKTGHGVRVGSGSARSYYVGISAGKIETGVSSQAICLVERGLDEGSNISLKDRDFLVLANQPVSFDLYSSSFRSGDRSSEIISVDESLTKLPSLQTIIRYGKKGEQSHIPVSIEACYTEIGTIEIWCNSRISEHRWKLQFQIRESEVDSGIGDQEIFESSQVEAVYSKLKEAFLNSNSPQNLESLVKDISQIIQRPREKWPLSLIRGMSDELLSLIQLRLISPNFESRWLNLLGFCLRPGFGDGFDEHRIKSLWKIYKQGPVHTSHVQTRLDWWILWRRVSGGLSAGHQRQFFQDLTPLLFPSRIVKQKILPQESLEVWMAVASMERLSVKDKIKAGNKLLAELQSKKVKPQHFWAVSRIGARDLLYGPVDRVIPPSEVTGWIETILAGNWMNPSAVGLALVQLARKTGDRSRDVDKSVIDRILAWLFQHDSARQTNMLTEVVQLNKNEVTSVFGEDLPSGLMLTIQKKPAADSSE